ncbi:hypothetical protein ACWC2H_02040 [Streptomyces sp. 900105755]
MHQLPAVGAEFAVAQVVGEDHDEVEPAGRVLHGRCRHGGFAGVPGLLGGRLCRAPVLAPGDRRERDGRGGTGEGTAATRVPRYDDGTWSWTGGGRSRPSRTMHTL